MITRLLDDPGFLRQHDPGDMLGFTAQFPHQVSQAFTIAYGTSWQAPTADIHNVVLTGMGGSAAGGDYLASVFDDEASIPAFCNRDYVLPNWVGPNTLVIAASYSGNTEETLAAVNQAVRVGANVAVVTSGGQLQKLADAHGWPCTIIPGGQPPRTALGFMLIPALVGCSQMGLIKPVDSDSLVRRLMEVTAECGIDSLFDDNPAKQLAQNLASRIPLIYGLGSPMARVANRWKGQINENSKRLAYNQAQPELCHNEIVGWEGAQHQSDHWAVVNLIGANTSPQMQRRAEVVAEITASKTPTYNVHASGPDLISQMLSITLYGDWVSIYLAALGGEDPITIRPIELLKSELAKII